MQLRLQSSAGPFDPGFIDKLGELEAAMIAAALDPDKFTVAKSALPRSERMPCSAETQPRVYTVFVADEHFTVKLASDMSFLRFFTLLCLSAEHGEARQIAPADKTITPESAMIRFASRPTGEG